MYSIIPQIPYSKIALKPFYSSISTGLITLSINAVSFFIKPYFLHSSSSQGAEKSRIVDTFPDIWLILY